MWQQPAICRAVGEHQNDRVHAAVALALAQSPDEPLHVADTGFELHTDYLFA